VNASSIAPSSRHLGSSMHKTGRRQGRVVEKANVARENRCGGKKGPLWREDWALWREERPLWRECP
jgi:hypothetical protein